MNGLGNGARSPIRERRFTYILMEWQMKLFRPAFKPIHNVLSLCVLGTAGLLGFAPLTWAAPPSLGAASGFSVLGGTAVTCTAPAVITGAVGVAPGSAFTNTGCIIAGSTPPATNAAAANARTAFLSTYASLLLTQPTCTGVTGTLSGQTLSPGTYCTDAVAKAGTLTLNGPATGVWVFLVNGALTGTGFSVVMTGGGLPCNVFWVPTAATTMTTSALVGNILAGDAGGGSITLTGGTVAGAILANIAVTITGTSVIGCGALTVPPPTTCKGDDGKGCKHDDDGDKCESGKSDKHDGSGSGDDHKGKGDK